ncbi:MAG: ABC transporter permease, partial [Chloroflexota bacterium]|nr:ABC transporter permease [Chloroflexota bacterium]
MKVFVRRPGAPDSVAITGSVVGLLSLLFGWLTLKPNRLVAGTSLKLWDSYGWGFTAILICLWLLCLILSLSGKKHWHVVALGIISNSIVILSFVLAGIIASRLLEGEASFARVSLGAGVWLSSIGAYILIFSCRQGLEESPFWQNLVSWLGMAAVGILLGTGWLNDLSVIKEFSEQEARFAQELLNHVVIFTTSVIVGTLIGIPLGIWATRSRHAEKPVFFIASILQTMPSLALFGLLIAPLSALSFAFPVLREYGLSGIGAAPAIIALILYSLLPIVRNTYVGLNQLDPAVINAG